jgi:mono/diheme cytochrome c family protein
MNGSNRSVNMGNRIRIAIQLGLALSALIAAWPASAADGRPPPSSDCPQPRFTGTAPAEIYALTNPLAVNAETLAAGERIYRGKSGDTSCITCHGEKGDGKGYLASQFDPRPRNFTCAKTVNDIPDGQLFWIIRNGSPGTAMPPVSTFGKFGDQEIWQIVAYLRKLAR